MADADSKRRDAMRELLAAAPSATADSLMVDDDDGPYIWAGGLARHLIDRLGHGDTAEVGTVLWVAEELLTAADPDVTNLIQVGLFEGIQNVAGNLNAAGVPLRQEDFEPFLGPRSLLVWLELNGMWGGSTTPDE